MGSFLKELRQLTEADEDKNKDETPEGEDEGDEGKTRGAPPEDDDAPEDTETDDQKPTEKDDETEDKDEGTDEDEPEASEDGDEPEGDEEAESKDVGTVADEQGFAKSKSEMYAFGKTRNVTLLTKDQEIGGLDVTLQYVINPQTGAWSLRACLAGQAVEDMVEFDNGEDPSSLVKSLEKEQKITAKQAVQNLKPPVDDPGADE